MWGTMGFSPLLLGPNRGGVYQPIMSFRSEVKRVETKGLVKMSAQFTLVSTFSTLNVP